MRALGSVVIAISTCAACGPPPPPPAAPAPPAPPAAPAVGPSTRADPIPRIAWHDAAGTLRTRFALDEPVFGTIQLAQQLSDLRDLDDDPDLHLGVAIVSPRTGLGVECWLPRAPFRHHDRITVELAPHALANARLDDTAADVVIARDGSAATERGQQGFCGNTDLSASDRNVHVRLAYHRKDGSVVMLAFGSFALDDRQAHADLPDDRDPVLSAQLFGWLRDAYRDTWFVPLRAVMFDPPWITDRLDAFAMFQRDNGTCVTRFYSVNGRANVNHVPGYDREVPCPPADAPPTAPAAPAARSRRTR